MNTFASPRQVIQLLFVLTISWLFATASHTSAAEPLLWKFAVGDQYNFQMIQEMDMSMDIGPTGKTESSFKQTIDIIWKIEALDENGAATVTQHISRMQMDITAPGSKTVHYDTASDETPQGYAAMLAPVLTALTADKFTMTMLPNGEITKVIIPVSITEAMSRGPGAAMMGELATQEGLKKMTTQSSLKLPQLEDLVDGHEWSTKMEITNPAAGKIVIDTTYRYAGPREIEGQQFEVFVPTINTSFGSEESAKAASVKVTKQETTGEILFNRSAGRLESSTIDQHMESVITVAGNAINQVIDQKVSMKIVEPNDATQ